MYRVGDVVQICLNSHTPSRDWLVDPMRNYEGETAVITMVETTVDGGTIYHLDIDHGLWWWFEDFFKEPMVHNSDDLYDLWGVYDLA